MINLTLFAQLVVVATASALWEYSSGKIIEDSKWSLSYWLGVAFSKGVYFILGILILICVCITGIRNKLDGDSELVDKGFWEPDDRKPLGKITRRLPDTLDDIKLNSRVANHEKTYTNLRVEFDPLPQNSMQPNFVPIPTEKEEGKVLAIEECPPKVGVSFLEFEKLKKDNAIYTKKLQRTLEEKHHLEEEVASLQREARIISAAMKDHQSMTHQLEDMRNNLVGLKQQMEMLREDKETATKILSDIMINAHSHPLGDQQSDELVVAIPSELGNVISRIVSKKEIDRRRKKNSPQRYISAAGDVVSRFEIPETSYVNLEPKLSFQTDISSLAGETQGSKQSEDGMQTEKEASDVLGNASEETYTNALDGGEDEGLIYVDAEEVNENVVKVFNHPVTGSVAFQRFLLDNFGNPV